MTNNVFLAIPLTWLKDAKAALPLKCFSSNQIQGLVGMRREMQHSQMSVEWIQRKQCCVWMKRMKRRRK